MEIESKLEKINAELVKMVDSGLIDEEQSDVIAAMIENVLTTPTDEQVEITYSDDRKHAYFNGHRYYLKNKYYQKNSKLHIDVYEFVHNMTIPPGYDVHHKDINEANNDPSNLVLLSKAEHLALHSRLRIPAIYTCEICGKQFEGNARIKHRKICDNPECRKAYARIKAQRSRQKKSIAGAEQPKLKTKMVICRDCGIEHEVDVGIRNDARCPNCKKNADKERYKRWVDKHKNAK